MRFRDLPCWKLVLISKTNTHILLQSKQKNTFTERFLKFWVKHSCSEGKCKFASFFTGRTIFLPHCEMNIKVEEINPFSIHIFVKK